ncbi:hypothetical protein [Litchfieldella rifensis]|uniref:Uncharacterized protein n=1 Tax=Litchfieldella rifensis TaxID=762643 RepID=A0ABV7LMV1_9GAMM
MELGEKLSGTTRHGEEQLAAARRADNRVMSTFFFSWTGQLENWA